MAKRENVVFVAPLLLVYLLVIFLIFVKSSVTHTQAVSVAEWPMFGFDAYKSSSNPNETEITKSTVSGLKKQWQISLPQIADGSPAFLADVQTSQGNKNLIFVTTENGILVAVDEQTGDIIWTAKATGNSGPITSSPVIDPSNQSIYSYGADGKVHKYDIANGAEQTGNGWPLVVTYIPNIEKESAALTIGNGYLYVSTSAYPGDEGGYVGHTVAENLTTGQVSVFNSLCTQVKTLLDKTCPQSQSGIWGRPGAVIDPVSGNVFVSTGNGLFNPPTYLGDSIIELTPNLQTILDTYTPENYQILDNADEDLGSTMPAMVPTQTNSSIPEIAIQGGKDDKLRVINRQNLSGQGKPYQVGGELQTIPVNCNIFSQPISYTDSAGNTWATVTDMCDNLYQFKVVNSRLVSVYTKANVGRSTPVLVNGMLFTQTNGAINALDSSTGKILWTGVVGNMHWQSPIVVDGHVFVLTTDGSLTSFALSNSSVSSTLSPSVSPSNAISPTQIPVTPTYTILQLGPTGTK